MATFENRVVVIGAGMGGLAAAVELAAAGVGVTLIERQEAPGGKMREVLVDGIGIDSGPTVFTMRWVFEELFAAAGASFKERVALSVPERLARHSWLDGSQLDLYADVEASAVEIERFAGNREAEGYRRFAQASEEMFDTLDHTFMRRERPDPVGLAMSLGISGIPRLIRTRPFRSLWKELGNYFQDVRLRQLFGRYATYCGSSPFAAPATLALIAHAERAGVWLVDGGMQRLAESLAGLITESGGSFRYGTEARRLIVDGNRVKGVELDDGSRIDADAVVFNGDAAALSQGLLGSDVTRAVPDRSRESRSLSAITLSGVVKVSGFPLDHHTVFFGNDYEAEFKAIFETGRVCDEPTVYVCAQDRGHGRSPGPNSGERLFMLVNAPPQPMSEQVVADVAERTLSHLGRHGVVLEGIDSAVMTTPTDFAERFPGSSGAIYGWPTHGWSGSFRRTGSRGKIGGLYLAGGTVHPGPGVPMAAISGRLAAASLLEDLNR